MDPRILLLGFLFGLSAAVYHSLNSREKPQLPRTDERRTPIIDPNPPSFPLVPPQPGYDSSRQYLPRDAFRRRPPPWTRTFRRSNRRKEMLLVDNWQRSIMGLVELAKKNLESAKKEFKVKNYAGTIRIASASVENITRALIHCCGGRPDVHSGQIEALRLLLPRFTMEEKRQFEDAINKMVLIYRYKKTLKKAAENNFAIFSSSKEQARQVLESSTNVVRYFQSVLVRKFGEEIQLLTKVN